MIQSSNVVKKYEHYHKIVSCSDSILYLNTNPAARIERCTSLVGIFFLHVVCHWDAVFYIRGLAARTRNGRTHRFLGYLKFHVVKSWGLTKWNPVSLLHIWCVLTNLFTCNPFCRYGRIWGSWKPQDPTVPWPRVSLVSTMRFPRGWNR